VSALTLVPATALAVSVRRHQRAADQHRLTSTAPVHASPSDALSDDQLAVACSTS
jgi:hypothetical protein